MIGVCRRAAAKDGKLVIVEGNIGAGKTTLTVEVAGKLQAKAILEPTAQNPYLEKFYSDPKKYALKLQLWIFRRRLQLYTEALHEMQQEGTKATPTLLHVLSFTIIVVVINNSCFVVALISNKFITIIKTISDTPNGYKLSCIHWCAFQSVLAIAMKEVSCNLVKFITRVVTAEHSMMVDRSTVAILYGNMWSIQGYLTMSVSLSPCWISEVLDSQNNFTQLLDQCIYINASYMLCKWCNVLVLFTMTEILLAHLHCTSLCVFVMDACLPPGHAWHTSFSYCYHVFKSPNVRRNCIVLAGLFRKFLLSSNS